MKALRCNELGGPEKLSIEDIPVPELNTNEVLVGIKSASVNFPDVLMIQGLYQYQPPLPFTPGAEAAGIVEAIGSCLLYTSPSPRDKRQSRMPSSA